MENNTRKIVVLNNLKSQNIEQAIFILRDNLADVSPTDAVAEAQRLVDLYLENSCTPLVCKKKRHNLIRTGVIFLSCLCMAYIVFLFIR